MIFQVASKQINNRLHALQNSIFSLLLTIIFFINQQMHCQNNTFPYRLFKLKNSVRRGFIKETVNVKVKTKTIFKIGYPRCNERCEDHCFHLRKLSAIDERTLCDYDSEISDVTYRFCPQFDHAVGLVKGGIPKFRRDSRIDTPAFAPEFEMFTKTDDEIYRERYEGKIHQAEDLDCEPENPQTLGTSTKSLGSQKFCTQTSPQARIRELQQILRRR